MDWYKEMIVEDLKKTEGEIDEAKVQEMYRNKHLALRLLYTVRTIGTRENLPYKAFEEQYKSVDSEKIVKELNEILRHYAGKRGLDDIKENFLIIYYARKICRGKKRSLESPMKFSYEVRSTLELLLDLAKDLDRELMK